MATKRDDFFDPFVSFRREMDRMFDRFFDGLPASTGTGWQALTPAVAIDETDKEMIITAELPGVRDKDVEVSLVGDVLTIKGEKRSDREESNRGYHLSERSYGSFYRSIPLPAGIDTDKASAEFKNGVLIVTLPKTQEALTQVKKIVVKAS